MKLNAARGIGAVVGPRSCCEAFPHVLGPKDNRNWRGLSGPRVLRVNLKISAMKFSFSVFDWGIRCIKKWIRGAEERNITLAQVKVLLY